MKTYIYTVEHKSFKRGCNLTIDVYRIKNNQPLFVGSDDINTSSYKGNLAIASHIISKEDGHKMDKRGYELESKNIKIIGL